MTELETNGRFELTKEEFNKIRRSGLTAGTSDHPNRLEMIESLWVTNHRMIDPQTADCLYTGETVPLPERFNDIFERKQKKTPLPANIAALREAVAAFAKE